MQNDTYTICFETMCEGFTPVMFDDLPASFDTADAAQAELESDPEFYDGCFVVQMSEIGTKTIYGHQMEF